MKTKPTKSAPEIRKLKIQVYLNIDEFELVKKAIDKEKSTLSASIFCREILIKKCNEILHRKK